MIPMKEAVQRFQKANPDLTVTRAGDWDADWYVLEAVKEPGKPDYSDPFYGVNKHTGQITGFSPAGNFQKFARVMGFQNGSQEDEEDEEVDGELKHYGIQGQKWGVRRYQNPDGSLTPEGRERYLSPKGIEDAKNRIFKAKAASDSLGYVNDLSGTGGEPSDPRIEGDDWKFIRDDYYVMTDKMKDWITRTIRDEYHVY